jgi:hypothetical protein
VSEMDVAVQYRQIGKNGCHVLLQVRGMLSNR